MILEKIVWTYICKSQDIRCHELTLSVTPASPEKEWVLALKLLYGFHGPQSSKASPTEEEIILCVTWWKSTYELCHTYVICTSRRLYCTSGLCFKVLTKFNIRRTYKPPQVRATSTWVFNAHPWSKFDYFDKLVFSYTVSYHPWI